MGYKLWEVGCPCCQSTTCNCVLPCQIGPAGNPCNFPTTDIVMTLRGSGSSSCVPGEILPDGSHLCLTSTDHPISVDIPLSYNPNNHRYIYSWGIFDPVNPIYSGYFSIGCNQRLTLDYQYQSGPPSSPGDLASSVVVGSSCSPLTIEIYPIFLAALCTPNEDGSCTSVYPGRVYTEAIFNQGALQPPSGYCVDICVKACVINDDGTQINSIPVPSSIITITPSGSNKTITGTTNGAGCVNLNIGNSGNFTVDIQSQYGELNKSQFLKCGPYNYLYPPCYYKKLSDGYTWKFTYSNAFLVATENYYNEIPACFGSLGATCSWYYCSDCNGLSDCGFWFQFPGNPVYYNVTSAQYNPNSLDFTITKDSIYVDEWGYISEIKLLYAHVIYTKAGAGQSCSYAFGGAPVCVDYAYVEFGYVAVIANDFSDLVLGCPSTPGFLVNVDVADLQQPAAGTPCGNCNGFPQSTQNGGWCGPTAIADAKAFIANLPRTIQYGDYGSWGIGSAESFPADPTYQQSTINLACDRVTYGNHHRAAACCDTIVFDGYNTFSWSPQ